MTSFDLRLVLDLDQENLIEALTLLSEAGVSFKVASVTSSPAPARAEIGERLDLLEPDPLLAKRMSGSQPAREPVVAAPLPAEPPSSLTNCKNPDCVHPTVTGAEIPPKSLDYVTSWRPDPLGGSWVSTARTSGDLHALGGSLVSTSRTNGDLQVRLVPPFQPSLGSNSSTGGVCTPHSTVKVGSGKEKV